MATYLADMFEAQWGPMDVEVWVEPFAGGLGAGLTLLDRGVVGEVWFSEKNPALAGMWRTLIADPGQFADRIERVTPTLDAYREAAEVVAAVCAGKGVDDLTAGVAAFIVNRCSRSGIVAPRVGPIGGKAQTGRWTIASRFHPQRLADRVRHVGTHASNLRFLGDDAITTIRDLDGSGIEDEVMLFVDPPYVREGNRLYSSGMTPAEHEALAEALNESPARWALTYDDEPLVGDVLYPGRRLIEFDIAHTANRQRIDRDYLLFSPNLRVLTGDSVLPRGQSRWLRTDDHQWLPEVSAAVGGPAYCQDELPELAQEVTRA